MKPGEWAHCSAVPKPRLPHLNERLFTSYRHARDSIEEWRIDYNLTRPHTSLGGLTPYEFANRSGKDHNVNKANL